MNRCLIAFLAIALLATTDVFAAEKTADQILQDYVKILGEEIRTAKSDAPVHKFMIYPDTGIEGLPFGSTVEKANEILGNPTGLVRLGETKIALIYGKAHALIFRRNKFISAFGTPTLLNTSLPGAGSNPEISMVIAPGIELGMEKEMVEKFLNKKIGDASLSFDFSYETENADVAIKFVKSQGRFQIFSYTITNYGK